MKYEDLVPFCNVRCFVEGSNEEIINFNSFGGNDEAFIYENQLGLESVDISIAGGGTKVSLKIPLNEKIVDRVSDESSPLYSAMFLGNQWSLKYGWGGGRIAGASSKISRMKAANFGVDYDPVLRTYMLNIELVPAYKLTLGNITLDMLHDSITIFEEELEKIGGSKNIGKNNNKFSPGNIISQLLINARGIIGKKNLYIDSDPKERIRATRVRSLDPENPGQPYLDPETGLIMEKIVEGYIDVYDPITGEWETVRDSDEVREKLKTYTYFLPKEITTASIEDIPDPDEDILISLIGKTEKDCSDLIYALRNESITAEAQKTFSKLFDREYRQNTSVYKFITSILEDSGFSLYHSPGILDPKTGEMAWLIIPLSYNDINYEYKSVEYRGLLNPSPIPPEEKSIRTLFGDTGEGFDLHSRGSVVLSLQANTDASQPSLAAAQAAEALARSANSDIGEGDTLRRHLNSMYSLFVKQSKTVSMTMVGIPRMRPFNTLMMRIAGKLFSGTYKVMRVEHSIGDSFTTNVEMVQLLENTEVDETKNNEVPDEESNELIESLSNIQPGRDLSTFPEFEMNTDTPDNTRF